MVVESIAIEILGTDLIADIGNTSFSAATG
jgi:hypothetical protein